MTNKELIEDFFSHISDTIDYPASTERFWEKAFMDDKNYVIPYDSVCKYVRQIIKIPYGEFLLYVRQELSIEPFDSKNITQCSSFVACERDLCKILIEYSNPGFSYEEIGKLLKGESGSDKEGAIRKYGENQIKTARQLGLAFEYYDDWYLSILGYVYLSLTPDEQHSLLARTILRDELYAKILCDLSVTDVDLLSYMDCISSESTKARRYGCVKFLVEICLEECKKDNVYICKILPRRPFQKKNDEWIAKHYDFYTPIAVTNHENLPINVARRAHIIISNEGSARDRYLNLISAVPPMKSIEEKELILKGLNGDKASLDAVIESYLPIIHDLARIYNKLCPNADVQDLVGEGVLAIYESLSSFMPEYNTRLLSYAMWKIKQNMKSFASKCLIHIPFEIQTIIDRVIIERSKFIRNNERIPSIEEMAEIMGISVDRVYSLNAYSSLEFVEIQEDEFDSDTASDSFLNYESLSNEVSRTLSTLTPREADILRKFFGIGAPEKSLEEIGDKLHLTRERVRQIKEKAIRKLNSGQRSHILQTYLGGIIPSIEELEAYRGCDYYSIKTIHNINKKAIPDVSTCVDNEIIKNLHQVIAKSRKIIKTLSEWLKNKIERPPLTNSEIYDWENLNSQLDENYSILKQNIAYVSDKTIEELRTNILGLRKLYNSNIALLMATEKKKSSTPTRTIPNISSPNETLQLYIKYFNSLTRSKRNGELAPHKIILLLAVLALYKNPEQQKTTLIKLSDDLKSLFDQYWKSYVKSDIWAKGISMPWKHMISEPFWHYDEKSNTTYIDKELRVLLKETENRIALRDVLKEQLKN